MVLFLLSLALLYLGGTIQGALGIGLSLGGFVCLVSAIISVAAKLSSKGNLENKAQKLEDRYKSLDEDFPPKLRYLSLIKDVYPDNEKVVETIHKHALKSAMQNGEQINLQFVIMSILMAQHAAQKNSELTKKEMSNIWNIVLKAVDGDL